MPYTTIRWTGALLIFLAVYMNLPFAVLSVTFDYPDVLRQPAGRVLEMYAAGGLLLSATWYAYVLAALVFIPATLMVHSVLAPSAPLVTRLATTFGVLGGTMMALGLIRWVFVVPHLATTYTDPAAAAASREAAVVLFEGLHRYAGVAVGEHLGQLFTGLWTLGIATALRRQPGGARWLSVTGWIVGAGLLVGLSEGIAIIRPSVDVGAIAAVTPVAYIGLSIWILALGVKMTKSPNVE